MGFFSSMKWLRFQPWMMLAIGLMLPVTAEAQYNSPVYNPHTKSYFELRKDNQRGYWVDANSKAQSLSHKGARGRLAVVLGPSGRSRDPAPGARRTRGDGGMNAGGGPRQPFPEPWAQALSRGIGGQP